MGDLAFVDEVEGLEGLLEKPDRVLLERHHVLVQDRLEIAPRSAENKFKLTNFASSKETFNGMLLDTRGLILKIRVCDRGRDLARKLALNFGMTHI